MEILIAGLVIFFSIHSISIVKPGWRDASVEKIGLLPWQGLYSLVAMVGFVLIVWGYSLAQSEPIVVYTPPVWLRYVAVLLLVPVFPLLIATYLPGRIQATLKHPMLVAVKLWALAHLLANGGLADIFLFGSFLAWAVLDRISLKRRPTPAVPKLQLGANDILSILVGLLLYVGFVVWGHAWLLGVPVIPY